MRRRRRLLAELDQDIRDHLEEEVQDNMARGMSPEDARFAALRKFGSVTRVKERTRAVWYAVWWDELLQDLRYGIRTLRRSPGLTAIAVLTLALGIGANSTIFSWINETLLNPIPGVSHANQCVELSGLSYLDYVDLRDRNQSFSALVAGDLYPMELTGSDNPQNVWGVLATANYFDGLGVTPFLGRGFLPEEGAKPDGAPVVVLSYHLWQTRFGGERSIIGRVIQINQHPYTVVGIAPPAFVGTQAGLQADLWVPASMVEQLHQLNLLPQRGNTWLLPIGRLKPGVSRQQAQAEMNVLMAQIVRQYPNADQGDTSIRVYPLWRAPFGVNDYLHTVLFLLFGVSGVVLLLACANVANLLLVRSLGRRREMAIRLSIGASRGRLIRQLLVESVLLALGAGGLAMLLTLWTARTLTGFIPASGLPIAMPVHTDSAVLLATLILSLLTSAICGVWPALRSAALEPVSVLKEGASGTDVGVHKARLSGVLVVAQVAMSLLLLVSAGLFIRSLRAAQTFDPGFNPHHVLLYSYDLRPIGYTPKTGIEFDHQLLSKLNALPGIQSASLVYRWRASWVRLSDKNAGAAVQTVPLSFFSSVVVEPEGYVPQPHEPMDVQYAEVTPGYLRTLQIPLIKGRAFSWNDTADSQLVTIVSQQFADHYWPDQDAIGKRLRTNGGRWFTVIGIAQDSDYDSLGEQPKSFFYLPLTQAYFANVTIEARTVGDPLLLARSVEQTVHALNSNVALYDLTTFDSRITLATSTQRMGGTFIGGFGLVALGLAAIGIYGVLAYTTRQRTREIGVRVALGAEPRNVCGLVLVQGARLALMGIMIGLFASLALTRALSSELFGVSTTDPLTYASVALLLWVVALLACYIPARRAMNVDPVVALRGE